jgi:hypothetical protein
MSKDNPVTISFLEETLCRFIEDRDLWDEYKTNKEAIHKDFISFCIVSLPGIEIS